MNKRHGTHVILKAFAPAQKSARSDRLVYTDLVSSREYFQYPSLLLEGGTQMLRSWKRFKTSEVHEEMQIATLLMAAHRLQSAWMPHAKLFWSAQLTTRSVALFGRPMRKEVSRMALRELESFQGVVANYENKMEFFEPALRAYGSLISKRTKPSKAVEQRYRGVLTDVYDYFMATYGDVFSYFDRYSADASVAPVELAKAFTAVLKMLAKYDEGWNAWAVVSNDSAKLSVDVQRSRIVVGRYRAPVAIDELKGLFAHEILIHAHRALRGRRASKKLGAGLPGYLTAEEGLGVLVESAINGKVSDKVKDRYIDISLALGDRMRRPMSRHELFEVCYVREVIRKLAKGGEINLDRIEKEVWEHVNRIYRGSLGDKYIAVFTKDVAYYKGFVRMARYIKRESADKSMDQIFEHLLYGKFDPMNPSHLCTVKKFNTTAISS